MATKKRAPRLSAVSLSHDNRAELFERSAEPLEDVDAAEVYLAERYGELLEEAEAVALTRPIRGGQMLRILHALVTWPPGRPLRLNAIDRQLGFPRDTTHRVVCEWADRITEKRRRADDS